LTELFIIIISICLHCQLLRARFVYMFWLPVMSPRGWSKVNHKMKIDIPVFWTPVSIAMAMTSSTGLLKIMAMPHPLMNPSQGNPIPTKNTCQVINLKIYKLAQTPKTMMNMIKNKATGLRVLTKIFDTLGANLKQLDLFTLSAVARALLYIYIFCCCERVRFCLQIIIFTVSNLYSYSTYTLSTLHSSLQ
jgi:hypothetical protein